MNYGAAVVILIAAFGFAPLCHAETAGDKTSIKEIKLETQDLIHALKDYSVEAYEKGVFKSL